MESETLRLAKMLELALHNFVTVLGGEKPAGKASAPETGTVEVPAKTPEEGAIEFYKPEEIAKMDEKHLVKIFTGELELSDIPKSLKAKKVVLTVISCIINKLDKELKEFSRDELFLTADTIGAKHHKSSEATITAIREVLEEAAKDEDGAAATGTSSEDAGKEKKTDAATAKELAGAGEPSEKETLEAENAAYTEFAKEEMGEEDDLEEAECSTQVTAWVKTGAGTTDNKKIKADIAAQFKKDFVAGYVAYLVQYVGENTKTGEKFLAEEDQAYVHGSLVYCNGLPLEETDDENVGKDFASGKMFTLDEDENIVEVKAKKTPAKIMKKKIKVKKK